MYSPVKIEWGTIADDNYSLSHYVYLNTNYMKIIFDNIFKNIYGHLDRLNPLNSFNKFNIQIAGNEIKISISNQNTISPKIQNSNRNIGIQVSDKISKQRQLVINKYDLVVDNPSICFQSDKQPSPSGSGIGLSLINSLCQKMGVKWNLIDNDTEICFQLSIPVLGDSKQLGHFNNQQVIRRQVIQCTL